MYKPENNFRDTRHDLAAREIFEAEAEKEAHRAFEEVYLKRQDCNSVEEFKEILQKECEQNLRATVTFMRGSAAAAYVKAFEPDIAPEESFRYLVDACLCEKIVLVFRAVISKIA